jgi:hypothetical protein
MTAMGERRILPRVLLVLATVLIILGTLAVWVNRQALNTDYWTSTSGALLENDQIRGAVAAYTADQALSGADLEQRLRQALPPALDRLAPAAAEGLQRAAPDIADRLLQRPRVVKLWRTANREAHRALLDVINGHLGTVSTTGGSVTLNLRQIVAQIAPPALAGKLPPQAGELKIMSSNQLDAVQKGAKLLRALAIVLPLLALAALAAAVWLTPAGARRKTLTGVGLSILVGALFVLVARRLLGSYLVDQLTSPGQARQAASATWSIVTGLLADSARGLVLLGLLVLAASWLGSGAASAVSVRRWIAPTLRERPGIAYGVAVLGYLLLVLWGAILATRNFLPSLILLALLLVGVEILRRQVAHEIPRDGGLHLGDRVRDRRRRRQQDSDLDALERLAALHERGVISDEEFAERKAELGAGI